MGYSRGTHGALTGLTWPEGPCMGYSRGTHEVPTGLTWPEGSYTASVVALRATVEIAQKSGVGNGSSDLPCSGWVATSAPLQRGRRRNSSVPAPHLRRGLGPSVPSPHLRRDSGLVRSSTHLRPGLGARLALAAGGALEARAAEEAVVPPEP